MLDIIHKLRERLTDLHGVLLGSALVQVAGMALTLLVGVQLARYLGPSGYGVYGVCMAVIAIVGVPAQAGLPLLATRDAARAVAKGATTRLSTLFSWFLVRSIIFAGATATFAVAGTAIVAPALWTERSGIILLAGVLTVALTLATVLSSLLRGVGLNVTGQSIDHVARPALTAMLIFAGYWTLGDISVRGALLYQIAATGLCAIAALAAFVAIAPRQTAGSTPYEPGNWKQVAMAFTLNASLVALNGNYPVILASLLVPASDVGVLRVALSAVGFLALPGSVANLATLPTVARQAAEGDERGLARTLSHTTLAAAGATAFGLLIIILIGRPLLSFLFGSEYQDAATPLIILGAGQLLIASFGTAGSYLNVTGRERLVVKAFGLAVPIGLLASVALGLAFGISGVAAGTIVMAAVWHFHIFVIHRNEVRVPLFVGSAARHVWGKS